MKKDKGFTLAEVLITLGVIGIVAAMTIPNLVKNYQKQEYVSRLKKFYSITNQAMQKMMVDNNCPGDLACTGIFASGRTATEMGDSIASYFKVLKNCKVSATEKCFADVNYKLKWDGSGTGTIMMDWTSSYRFVLLDGMSVNLNQIGNCSDDVGIDSTHIYRCTYIAVDVNGPKNPNVFGRDTFIFLMSKDGKLHPNCGYGTGQGSTVTGSFSLSSPGAYWKARGICLDPGSSGVGCSARIMDEGWQMNY